MNSKTLLAFALASAFTLSNSAVYADDGKTDAPKPELTAQSSETSTPPAPAPELTAQSDEKSSPPAPKPELIAA